MPQAEQQIQQPGAISIIYSKLVKDPTTGHTTPSIERWNAEDLPYPFTEMGELVYKCSAINLIVQIGDTVYKLQTARLVPRIALV